MLFYSTIQLIEHLGIVREQLQHKLNLIDELLRTLNEENEEQAIERESAIVSESERRRQQREEAKERARQWARRQQG